MSDSINSSVSTTYGSVHAGKGDINYITVSLTDSRGKSPRAIADDHLLWLWQCFVEPGEFGRAREILAERGTVLLDGAPGSGRNTAAWMLLYELRSGTETLHELLLEDEDRTRRLDPDRVGDGDLLLLDLSGAKGQAWTEVQDELSSLRKAVREHAARLVVVLPQDRIERLRADLDQYRVEIARPPGMEVLQRYLRVDGIPPDETDFPPPVLSGFLDMNPPIRQIADFARFIVSARKTSRSGGGFTAWCENAHAALSGRGALVARNVAALRQGPQRALLLATAMLPGAHADVVHRAGVSLLRTVKYPQDECPLLEHADLVERFEEIGARTDDSGKTMFKELGYDSAVRAHFWKHMPELRDHLQAWVANAVDSASLESDDRDILVERFADQCLCDGYPAMLVSSASQWTVEPTTNPRLRAAAKALEKGLNHKEHGRFFRRQIYNWSQTRLPDRFVQVLVLLCFEVMAVRHPDEAMVRLHHLARRERGIPRARDTLMRLIGDEPRLYRLMLGRLTYAFIESEGRDWPVDVDLFLELVDPAPFTELGMRGHALIAEAAVRSQLTTGWSVVFQRRSDETWSAQAWNWLRAASENERYRDPLLDILVEGGGQRMDILSRLYVTARDLAHSAASTPDERERRVLLVNRVLQKINAAQGIPAA